MSARAEHESKQKDKPKALFDPTKAVAEIKSDLEQVKEDYKALDLSTVEIEKSKAKIEEISDSLKRKDQTRKNIEKTRDEIIKIRDDVAPKIQADIIAIETLTEIPVKYERQFQKVSDKLTKAINKATVKSIELGVQGKGVEGFKEYTVATAGKVARGAFNAVTFPIRPAQWSETANAVVKILTPETAETQTAYENRINEFVRNDIRDPVMQEKVITDLLNVLPGPSGGISQETRDQAKAYRAAIVNVILEDPVGFVAEVVAGIAAGYVAGKVISKLPNAIRKLTPRSLEQKAFSRLKPLDAVDDVIGVTQIEFAVGENPSTLLPTGVWSKVKSWEGLKSRRGSTTLIVLVDPITKVVEGAITLAQANDITGGIPELLSILGGLEAIPMIKLDEDVSSSVKKELDDLQKNGKPIIPPSVIPKLDKDKPILQELVDNGVVIHPNLDEIKIDKSIKRLVGEVVEKDPTILEAARARAVAKVKAAQKQEQKEKEQEKEKKKEREQEKKEQEKEKKLTKFIKENEGKTKSLQLIIANYYTALNDAKPPSKRGTPWNSLTNKEKQKFMDKLMKTLVKKPNEILKQIDEVDSSLVRFTPKEINALISVIISDLDVEDPLKVALRKKEALESKKALELEAKASKEALDATEDLVQKLVQNQIQKQELKQLQELIQKQLQEQDLKQLQKQIQNQIQKQNLSQTQIQELKQLQKQIQNQIQKQEQTQLQKQELALAIPLISVTVFEEQPLTPPPFLPKKDKEKRKKINLRLFRGRKQRFGVTFHFNRTTQEKVTVEARSFPLAVTKAQRKRRPRKKQPILVDVVKLSI